MALALRGISGHRLTLNRKPQTRSRFHVHSPPAVTWVRKHSARGIHFEYHSHGNEELMCRRKADGHLVANVDRILVNGPGSAITFWIEEPYLYVIADRVRSAIGALCDRDSIQGVDVPYAFPGQFPRGEHRLLKYDSIREGESVRRRVIQGAVGWALPEISEF